MKLPFLGLFVQPKRVLVQQSDEEKIEIQKVQTEEVQNILNEIKIPDIRRIMLLLNQQWVKEDGTTFSPDEGDIVREVLELIDTALKTGRKQGQAVVRHRGFTVEYGLSRTHGEIIGVTYTFVSASNVAKVTQIK